MIKDKNILIGVTGGIAAYKIPLLVRELKKLGANVRVVMTRAAAEFINPVTLAALSENKVIIETFPDTSNAEVEADPWHIHLGTWANIMLIAPATANNIAKLTYGIADNPVTIMALSTRCPVLISPSMDTYMWENAATQQNLVILQERGYSLINPEVGELASGLVGKGRLPEIKSLINSLKNYFTSSRYDFENKKILVTAGPTYEPIDPVRYIGNRSSGKMGFAIALSAALRGADVTLISGPSNLQTPRFVKRIDVETAEEMYNATNRYSKSNDIIIMTAAVADFTPVKISKNKIKKEKIVQNSISIDCKKTKDILESLGKKKNKEQILVGFSLETENEVANAKLKLKKKNLDMIVLNNPLKKGAEFGSDTNLVTIIDKHGRKEKLPKMSKIEISGKILNHISRLLK